MKCCVELPTLKEISNVLVNFGLQHVVEGHKAYSKDVLKRGRIKVKIADDNGNLCNTTIKNSKRNKKIKVIRIRIDAKNNEFYKIDSEQIGLEIRSEIV